MFIYLFMPCDLVLLVLNTVFIKADFSLALSLNIVVIILYI